MLRGVALVATTVVLLALVAEVVLDRANLVHYRALPQRLDPDAPDRLPHRAGTIAGLGYELQPDATRTWHGVKVRTNHYGMRGQEPASEAEGLVRVAVLGDSFTFGWLVEEEQSYPGVLARVLDSYAGAGVDFDVLNFGVVGYSTRDEALVFDARVRPFAPDLVVIGYVLNDPEVDPTSPLHAAFAPVEWWQYSSLLRLCASLLKQQEIRRIGGGDVTRYFHENAADWSTVVEGFASIRRTSRELDCEVLLTIFPLIPSSGATWEGYAYGDLHDKVAALGRENGFAVLDLLAAFAEHAPRELALPDLHPNARAYELAGAAIGDAVRGLFPQLFEPGGSRLAGR